MENWRPTDDDEARLSREELAVRLGNSGLTSVPARFHSCPKCHHPIALIVRPDTEVVTPDMVAALKAISDASGIPFCDPAVDHFPDCRHCDWKPEHGVQDGV
jgi:hypothetical protein